MNIAIYRAAAASTLAAVVMSLAPAQAATDAYTQLPNGQIANTSAIYNNSPSDPGFTWSLDQDEQIWSYFSLPQAVTFNRISWFGTNADGAFGVDLFAAACFSCGVNFVQTDGTFTSNLLPDTGPYNQRQLNKTILGGDLYAYSIDLSTGLRLGAGSYALSVVNNYSALPFQWAGSANGLGSHVQYIVGQARVLRAPGSLAFALTNTSAVPEPSIWLMLTAGMAGLCFSSAFRRLLPSTRQPMLSVQEVASHMKSGQLRHLLKTPVRSALVRWMRGDISR